MNLFYKFKVACMAKGGYAAGQEMARLLDLPSSASVTAKMNYLMTEAKPLLDFIVSYAALGDCRSHDKFDCLMKLETVTQDMKDSALDIVSSSPAYMAIAFNHGATASTDKKAKWLAFFIKEIDKRGIDLMVQQGADAKLAQSYVERWLGQDLARNRDEQQALFQKLAIAQRLANPRTGTNPRCKG